MPAAARGYVDIDISAARPPIAPKAGAAAPHAPSGGGRTSSRGRTRRSAYQAADSAISPVPPPAARPIDLFSASALTASLAAPPPTSDQTAGDIAGRKVEGWLAEVKAETEVGRAAPWRHEVEQRIEQQLRGYHPPADSRRVEIEAIIEPDGTLVSLDLIVPSGVRAFDRQTLAAVRRAIELRPLRDPRGRVRTRYAVDAAVTRPLPEVDFVTMDVPGTPTGVVFHFLRLHFDESIRKVDLDYAFKPGVVTRATLLSIQPQSIPSK